MNVPPGRRLSIWALARDRQAGAPPPVATVGLTDEIISATLGRGRAKVRELTSRAPFDPNIPVRISLRGHKISPDGTLRGCTTLTMSQNIVDLALDPLPLANYCLPYSAAARNKLTLDLDRIGRFSGTVVEETASALTMAIDNFWKEMVAEKLAMIVLPKSQIVRIEPDDRRCTFVDEQNHRHTAKIINISKVDALLRSTTHVDVDTTIIFDGSHSFHAVVTRTFEMGFEIKFQPEIPEHLFSAAITLHA